MGKIRNLNDGTQNEPYMRPDLNLGTLNDLPAWSTAPKLEGRELHVALKKAGFQGLQGGDTALCHELGIGITGGGRVNTPEEVEPCIAPQKEAGIECATFHVGWGIESDSEIDALLTEIIEKSTEYDFPIYIETHRATITQDIYRTVQFTERFPDIRFNGDFSHWYTGLEFPYGGVDMKLDFAKPVLDRVRFMHGRIGNPGCIQVDIGDGTNRSYVEDFKNIWTRCFEGFLKDAQPGDYLPFNPELLQPEIFYARTFTDSNGETKEEGDRYQQALLYIEIAQACFDQAKQNLAG